MGVQRGDFIGFTFDDIHSSELGLIRVSDGSRFSENLLPTIQDKTVQVPGGDGFYYFGSNYTQKTFTIQIAFDSLTEEQIRTIKKKFGDKKIHKLIFDELPYKYYMVKATGSPSLRYVPFDEEMDCCYESEYIGSKKELYTPYPDYSSKRVYKGEGTLTFVAYSPFARSRFKYKDYYNSENCPELELTDSIDQISYNLDAWIKSSGFKMSTDDIPHNSKIYTLDQPRIGGVAVYNPGDFETPFKLKINLLNNSDVDGNKIFPGGYIFAARDSETKATEDYRKSLKLKEFTLNGQDVGIQINTALNLIEGIDSNGKVTGNLYNKYIEQGDFFKIPVTNEICMMQFDLEKDLLDGDYSIEYDYLFF